MNKFLLYFFDPRIGLCVLLPLSIVALTAWRRLNGATQRSHDAAQQALESKGLASDLTLLRNRLQRTEDKSKAAQWKSLAKTISKLAGPLQNVIGPKRIVVPPPETEWELETYTRDFFEANGPLFAKLCELTEDHDALSLVPDDDDPIQWFKVSDNLFVSAGLEVIGCLAVRDNDEAGILKSIQNLYACRRTLQSVQPTIGAHTRFDFSQRGLSLLQLGLEAGLLGRESLEAIHPILSQYTEIDKTWLATIEFELAFHSDLMNGRSDIELWTDSSLPVARQLSSCVIPLASLGDRTRFLQLIKQWSELPTDNLEQFYSAQLICDAAYADLMNSNRFDLFSGTFTNDADAFVADAMRHRIALVAVAVQLYKFEHGQYPKCLDDIASSLGTDSGQAFSRIKLSGNTIGYMTDNSSATVWGDTSSPYATAPALSSVKANGQIMVWKLH